MKIRGRAVRRERGSSSAAAGDDMEEDVAEISPPSPRPISRRTRSQAAPGWTAQELLALANEVAAVEEDCRRALSAYQRWEIVAANCSAILGGAPRSAYQCRRRWDAALADYRRIQAWEEGASYWSMGTEERRAVRLPVDFDREVFRAVTRAIRAQEPGAEAGDVESESEQQGGGPGKDEDVIAVKEIIPVPGSKKKAGQTKGGGRTAPTRPTQEMAARKLQEDARRVHAILMSGQVGVGGHDSPEEHTAPPLVDLKKPSSVDMEFTRRKADELIKVLGSLVGGLDHFTAPAGDG